MITQSKLKKILHYNEITGVFTRRFTIRKGINKGDVVGCLNKGYLTVYVDNRAYRLHRLAWLYVYGEHPLNQIDHINGVRDDNSIANLRDVTNKENHKNKTLLKNNKSGVAGVSWCKRRNRFRVNITVDLRHIHIGCYKSFLDAVCARKSKELSLGFHENHGKGRKYQIKG